MRIVPSKSHFARFVTVVAISALSGAAGLVNIRVSAKWTEFPTDGLIVHYAMDENNGPTAFNTVTDTRHAELVGATWTEGWQNSGLAFGRPATSGTSYAFTTAPISLASNEVTFASWVYPKGDDMASNWQAIMSDVACCNYRVLLYPGGHPYINTGKNADWYLPQITVQPDQWHHIALSIKGGASAKLYIDGVEVATQTAYVPMALPTITSLALGSGERTSGFYYSLNGKLDEVRVYTRQLSGQEIEQLASGSPAPLPTPTPTAQPPVLTTGGLIVHYDMDENTGTTAFNTVTDTRHAQLLGATWTAGWQNSGLSFVRPAPGGTSYAYASGPISLASNEVTFASWVYPKGDDIASNWQAIMSDVECCTYRMLLYPGGHPYINAGENAPWYLPQITVQPDQWHHIALTIKGGASSKLYIDGVEVASQSQFVPMNLPNLTSLALGSGERTSGFYYSLNGKLDEVRVYDRQLSGQEIAQLASSLPTPTPTPTAAPTLTPTPAPTADPRECSISINDGKVFTNKRQVIVGSFVSNSTNMRLSNDGGLSSAPQVTYTSSYSWTLNDPGKRIATLLVYARYYGSSGIPLCGGASIIDDIIYDPMPPRVGVKPVIPVTNTNAVSVTLDLDADDQEGGSGVSLMQVSTDSGFAGSQWQPYSAQARLSARGSDRVYVRVADEAGNVSAISASNLTGFATVYLPMLAR